MAGWGFRRDRGCSLALVLAAGCYVPNPKYLGVTDDSSTGPDTSTTMAMATTSDDSSSSSTTDASETTGAPDPICGDGNPDPGEFCFESVDVSMLWQVQSLAAGDFDGDGKLDLALGRRHDVSVSFGDGLGGFPLQLDLPEPNGNYGGMAAGDLDGDQLADLLAVNRETAEVLVYLSTGDGSFAAPIAHSVGNQPTQLAVTDFDGDSVLDAVVAVEGADAIAVLFGDGLGGLSAPSAFASGGDRPLALSLGHFDQDDSIDVAVANFGSDELSLLLSSGPGQLAAPQAHLLGGNPRAVVVADFDLDGALDVAAPLEDVDRVAMLFGQGTGGLLEPALELDVGDKPVGAAAADLDNDLAPDLLVLNLQAKTVGVLLNDVAAPGQLGDHQTLVGLDNFPMLAAIVIADFNADGVDDAVVAGSGVRALLSNP